MQRSIAPTSTDLQIYESMKRGNDFNGVVALQDWQKTGFRDTCYRLRKGGYPVSGQWVYYKTEDGKPKKYMRYFVREAA